MPRPSSTPWAALVALAAAVTAVNAFKPCQADDHAYLAYASEFARHPLAPYAFEYTNPPGAADANLVLVPPVLPYWLAVAVRLGGDDPVWLRAWLLPFVSLFALSFHALARRAGCPFPLLLAAAALLSPAALPGMNCMLDVPAISLVLAAAVLQLRAGETRSCGLALLSGVVAGLAMQTKYTAFVCVPLLAAAALVHGRWRLAACAAALAAGLFVAWELALWAFAGQSHFLTAAGVRSGSPLLRMARLILPTVSQLGGLAGGLASAVLLGLGRPRLAALTLALTAGAAASALLPSWGPGFGPGHVAFGAAGLLVCAAGLAASWSLLRHADKDTWGLDAFLVFWLAAELGASLALSPFPAARRYVGLCVVLALVAGRLASRGTAWPSPTAYRLALGATAALGLCYFAVDWADAAALRDAARRGYRRAEELAGPGRVWALSWFTFQLYAEKEGARPFNVNRPLPRPGDVLLLVEHELSTLPSKWLPESGVDLVEAMPYPDPALRLGAGYYAGRLPLTRRHGPPCRVLLYRCTGPIRIPSPG